MAIHKHMSFFVLVYTLLGVFSSLKLGHGSIIGGHLNRSCIESEKQALLLLKESLVDDLNYLSSWVGDDCCAWHGIGCNNITGHVTQLSLRNGDLRASQTFPSLLDLKSLNYLDLSNNSFYGMKIPEYFGSFKDLIYLNLSASSFSGLVPHHLGNLSNLRYLDLSSYSRYYQEGFFTAVSNPRDYHAGFFTPVFILDTLSIDSMEWLSKLSSLEHLSLSSVNLSMATDWFSSINMLSNSILVLEMRGCELPNSHPSQFPFMNLTSLVSVDLGDNRFNSTFPLWILNNTGLAHLNLDYNNLHGPIPESIGNLTSLTSFDISANKFQGSLPQSIARLNSLIGLYLGYNNFEGLIPESIGNLTSLSELDLSRNMFEGLIPKSIGNLTSLSELDLSRNMFEGLIPKSIGNLTSLSQLDLSCNMFEGVIPESIGNLTSLSQLYLSLNKFEDVIPISLGALTSLTILDLTHNNLHGFIPKSIGSLTSLLTLHLSYNELKGCLWEEICQLSKLEILDVDNNQLSGNIPKCIGELSNLEELDISSNSWEGNVSEHHFVNLRKLLQLRISSYSNLVWNVSSEWVPPFKLEHLYMESLNVGPKFPRWLLTQIPIHYIRMPNTSISDTIPADWFVRIFLSNKTSRVDLSNNDISVEQLSSISVGPNHMDTFSLSKNRFSGEFPAFVCNFTSLYTLVLSNNNFSGTLPQCLGNLKILRVLDVLNNSLSGDIPVSLGSLGKLYYLNLFNNKFEGKLPTSFQNLTELVLLDVGKNHLSDIIPHWTGQHLPSLRYFILRSNNFYGEIPIQLCNHSSIKIINLAQNQITGNIPSCFGNFSAMATGGGESELMQYGQMIIDNPKGYELPYTRAIGFQFSIDLSDNNISGEIPKVLMDLRGLVTLNLAGNHLVGRIPDKIGQMEKLESLDLSRNKLCGPIPPSLSNLNFLSHLNLSFNNLSGRIPTGYQLTTLNDPSIYAGNNQLCGLPILKSCPGNVPNSDKTGSDSDDEHIWFYTGIGPGLLVGFLGFCGSLHFIKSWRYTYFHNVDLVFDKVAVAIALLWRKFRN